MRMSTDLGTTSSLQQLIGGVDERGPTCMFECISHFTSFSLPDNMESLRNLYTRAKLVIDKPFVVVGSRKSEIRS